jgi:hypothetical protein
VQCGPRCFIPVSRFYARRGAQLVWTPVKCASERCPREDTIGYGSHPPRQNQATPGSLPDLWRRRSHGALQNPHRRSRRPLNRKRPRDPRVPARSTQLGLVQAPTWSIELLAAPFAGAGWRRRTRPSHRRNNVWNWPTREVAAPRGAKGFDYYSLTGRRRAEPAALEPHRCRPG